MSIVGGFFNAKNVNGIYDRAYNAEDFAAYFANFISSGVFAKPSDQMKVVPGGGLSVDVSVGKGYIKGYWVNIIQTEHIIINPNMTGHEEQLKVVCKIDFDTRRPVLEVRENVDSLLPDSEYELVLATFSLQVGESEITTAMITDRRPDKEYCGFVTGLVDQVDFKTLMEQEKAQFEEWFNEMKGQLSEDAAGNLQMQIDSIVVPTQLAQLSNYDTVTDVSSGRTKTVYVKQRRKSKYNDISGSWYEYADGPDILGYNSSGENGIVDRIDDDWEYGKTWAVETSAYYGEGGEIVRALLKPKWVNDWRFFKLSERGSYDDRIVTTGAEIYYREYDGNFTMLNFRISQDGVGLVSGSECKLIINNDWILHALDIKSFSEPTSTVKTLRQYARMSFYDSSVTPKKILDADIVYRLGVKVSTGSVLPAIFFDYVNAVYGTGYTSAYKIYLSEIFRIGTSFNKGGQSEV